MGINQLPDQNPMPEFNLFPRLVNIAKAVGRFLTPLPAQTFASHGDHLPSDQQLAEQMMSSPEAQEAFEQLRIEFDSQHDWTQYPDNFGYDDMGNYTDM